MSPDLPRYPGRAPIDAYGNGGFRFAGMSHRGSILCMPDAIVAWDVDDVRSLTPSGLELLIERKASIGLLLLGTGRTQVFPGEDVRTALAEAGIALEVMDTGAACRTYNVLLAEGRPVAAAVIAVE